MEEFEEIEKLLAEELKPCPFCGCEDIKLIKSCNYEIFYFAECVSCRARGGDSLNERIAYAAWQKRKPSDK